MGKIETMGILDEIQSLVSDSLQVVSYKWLSRNFLVSSNVAKRLLEEFVEKHGSELEVVYSLSGWLKNIPSTYHIKLVPKPKLAEAKQDYDDNCSVQIYSVQTCIPKDPAALWNAEFAQAEELFNKPLGVDNCLRDNRFCGVSNSYVKRNGTGTGASAAVLPGKGVGTVAISKSSSTNQTVTHLQPQSEKIKQSGSKIAVQSPSVCKNNKSDSHIMDREQGGKLATEQGKPVQVPQNKKAQNGKNSSGDGALANMWGRASAKSTTDATLAGSTSAEAQISAHEAVEYRSSDEDAQDVNFRRKSSGDGNRKRRVVFEFSDEEDEYNDAVSLSSPDPPKRGSAPYSKEPSNTSAVEKSHLSFKEEKEEKPTVDLGKEERESIRKIGKDLSEESYVRSKSDKMDTSSSEKVLHQGPEIDASTSTDCAPKSPKRRKVLKTRIDDRGREVTEVVWEGEEETKNDTNTSKKSENVNVNNAINRPTAAKKTPVGGGNAPTHHPIKSGNKKAGNKDPKQGNILSFFKRV